MDELLLLLYISRPVSLDVSVELILQRVAVVFSVQFTNLKHRQFPVLINQQKEARKQQEKRPSEVMKTPNSVNLQCRNSALYLNKARPVFSGSALFPW